MQNLTIGLLIQNEKKQNHVYLCKPIINQVKKYILATEHIEANLGLDNRIIETNFDPYELTEWYITIFNNLIIYHDFSSMKYNLCPIVKNK